MEPTRLLLCGDCHHDLEFFAYLCRVAVDNNCDELLQCGDFGFYPHTRAGIRFLRGVPELLREYNLVCRWLDGNHENFTALFGGDWDIDNGFWKIAPRLYYVPRGLRWSWSGATFCAIGGAYSSDRDNLLRWEHRARVSRWWWWPQETITRADVARAVAGGPVDVLITHDCPLSVRVPGYREWSSRTEAHTNRALLDEVWQHTRPSLLFHGHLHHYYQTTVTGDGFTTHVTGLNCNELAEVSWTVLDLGALHGPSAPYPRSD